MGCFSWIDCQGKTNITDKGILLLPREFEDRYFKFFEGKAGDCKITGEYNGYGRLNGIDVYDVVAILNICFCDNDEFERTLKAAEYQKPVKSKFGGLWEFEKEEYRSSGLSEKEINKKDKEAIKEHYEKALIIYKNQIKSIKALRKDFLKNKYETLSDLKKNPIVDTYSWDFELRSLGILIACYDEQNAKLPYPIKVTLDQDAIYEAELFSMGDPEQGCGNISKKDLKTELARRDKILAETKRSA